MKILYNRRGAEAQRRSISCRTEYSLYDLCCSWIKAVSMTFLFILPSHISQAAEPHIPDVPLDLSDSAVKRGEEVFRSYCQSCHSLKYLGYEAMIPPDAAREAFGKVPPDLSLMTKARGRGDKGARYVYALLISYNDTPEKNAVFPNTAMPSVFSKDEPELEQKANDVAAFLSYAAEPTAGERKKLGRYVLGYMVVLTTLLYFLNRRTWKGIK